MKEQKQKQAGKMDVCKGCDKRLMWPAIVLRHGNKHVSDWCPDACRACDYLQK